MLPNPALKPLYEKIVWLWVHRDFSQSAADRAAERVMQRFGVSSYPQHFLVDPHTLAQLADTGRAVQSFLAAADRAGKVRPSRSLDPLEKQIAAEKRADALEREPTLKAAKKALESDDIIERLTGLQIVSAKDPRQVVALAEALLAVPNDPFRYTVCDVLKKAASTGAARALEAVVKKPPDSRNPNVLRMRAVQALATCGDQGSVPVIGEWAATGAYFNGLTGVSIDALVAIKARVKGARKAVDAILKKAYPKPPDPPDERSLRACVALAKRVHKALGSRRDFPKVYDAAARAKLMR